MVPDRNRDLKEKDFVDSDGEVKQRKKRKRKTIGEEGSRRQTVIGLIATLVLGLMFYLPAEFKNWWGKYNQTETITIEKPIGDSEDISSVVGFKVKIVEKQDAEKAVDELLKDLVGSYGIWVESFSSGEGFYINKSKIFKPASLNKIPVLIEYYSQVDSGEIDPNKSYILKEKDRWEYGTGSMQNQPAGTEYSYQEVADLVANQSDNMGALLLSSWVGEKLVDEISLNEMAEIFRDLYKDKLVSKESKEKLLLSLTDTVNEDRITAGVPSGVRVAHKFGSEEGIVNDCGIVYADEPYVICLMSSEINSGEAGEVLPKISRVVWEWASQ